MPAFAKRMEYMAGSAAIIRGLFGAMNDPETISFGGGAPASDALPVEQIREIASDVLKRDTRGVEALQYGPVQGIKQLREIVAEKLLVPKGVLASANDILIVNGGLETMNLLCQFLSTREMSSSASHQHLSIVLKSSKCLRRSASDAKPMTMVLYRRTWNRKYWNIIPRWSM